MCVTVSMFLSAVPPLLADGAAVHLVPQADMTEHARELVSEQPQAVITGVPLATGLHLRSADNLQTPFTNYVRGYSGLLDYIW